MSLLTLGLNFQVLFSNRGSLPYIHILCSGVSNILELSIVLVCLRPIFLQSFSVIVTKRFLNNAVIAENNSCFGVLIKLKFSITSVCLRPIFLHFFTNFLLNSFVSVCFRTIF